MFYLELLGQKRGTPLPFRLRNRHIKAAMDLPHLLLHRGRSLQQRLVVASRHPIQQRATADPRIASPVLRHTHRRHTGRPKHVLVNAVRVEVLKGIHSIGTRIPRLLEGNMAGIAAQPYVQRLQLGIERSGDGRIPCAAVHLVEVTLELKHVP